MNTSATMIVSVVFGLFAVTQSSLAQEFVCEVESASSSLQQTNATVVPFDGTLIGNYEEEGNPEGTRTVPGLFGGSGNNPIDYGASFEVGGEVLTAPTGSFSLDVASGFSSATIRELTLDLLGGSNGTYDFTMNILYSTFRTYVPTSVYPGGIEIPIPLGEAQVNVLTMVQTAEAVLVLTPTKDAGVYSMIGAIPVETTTSIVAFDQEFGGEPTPSILPINGTLTIENDTVLFDVEFSTEYDEVLPASGAPFEDVALDLPTVLPPGGTAHLLLSGETGEGSSAGLSAIHLVAMGETEGCTMSADFNGDGRIDGGDLTILLGSWGDAGGEADINCDGQVDGADLTILLGDWTG